MTLEEKQTLQKKLNVVTRAEGYMDIMMYVPDNNVKVADVTSNDISKYSDIRTISNIKDYTSSSIATLEENLWLLNGRFITPSEGRTYKGYMSNSVSNENGQFKTNPNLDIKLSMKSKVEYMSIILNPSVKSGYPKIINLYCYDENGTQIGSTLQKDISKETSLPNVVYEVNLENVASLKLEFVDTATPYRRIRVSNIMFGKVLTLDQDQVENTDYLDKCSYVVDTIPSRTFSFTVNNYDKKYNVDNPNNSYMSLDKQTKIMFRNGYNVYGYYEEVDDQGNTKGYIENPNKVQEIVWDGWKELRLMEVTTDGEDTCTFSCGSILDIMDDTYTHELFPGEGRRVAKIVEDLLNFEGLPLNTITFSTDDNNVNYGDYIINTVLPDAPVREIIQLLAFSIGATILIQDDNTIRFANVNINDESTYPYKHKFTYDNFESTPSAEELEHTDKISLPKYNTKKVNQIEEKLQTIELTAFNQEVNYGECTPTKYAISAENLNEGSVRTAELYSRRGFFTSNLVGDNPLKVDIIGYKLETKQTQDRTNTSDTLIIDTQLMGSDTNDVIKNKYKAWYNKKFKYTMNTRGEILVNAGDFAEIETPFSGTKSKNNSLQSGGIFDNITDIGNENNYGEDVDDNLEANKPENTVTKTEQSELLRTYVLSNHITFDGTWSGDMEVIAL